MTPFRYIRAANPASALAASEANPHAAFLAGGTTLLDLMKVDVEQPRVLIDISTLPTTAISFEGDVLHIGALATNTAIATSPAVKQHFTLLSEAILSGASAQIRNMATAGGNLLQRTRCAYFRNTALPCNKRSPGSGCGAWDGYNRTHAILGGSEHCIATHPSDMAVAITALDAAVLTRNSAGEERRVRIREFYRLPGSTPQIETVLRHGELIIAIEIPALPAGSRSIYKKVRDRASFEFALSSAAVVLHVRDGRIQESRIALGGVATIPWHVPQAEGLLQGNEPNADLFQRAATAALNGAIPRPHNAFKPELARRTLIAALTEAAELNG